MKMFDSFINNGPAALVFPALLCLYVADTFVFTPIEHHLRRYG